MRGGHQIDTAPRERGTLIAFPANVLHQVTPIRNGDPPRVGGLGGGTGVSVASRQRERSECLPAATINKADAYIRTRLILCAGS